MHPARSAACCWGFCSKLCVSWQSVIFGEKRLTSGHLRPCKNVAKRLLNHPEGEAVMCSQGWGPAHVFSALSSAKRKPSSWGADEKAGTSEVKPNRCVLMAIHTDSPKFAPRFFLCPEHLAFPHLYPLLVATWRAVGQQQAVLLLSRSAERALLGWRSHPFGAALACYSSARGCSSQLHRANLKCSRVKWAPAPTPCEPCFKISCLPIALLSQSLPLRTEAQVLFYAIIDQIRMQMRS